jgi:hypothetical protein
VGGKRKAAENSKKRRSQQKVIDAKREARAQPPLHALESALSSKPGRSVTLPLVRSKQPGTLALENATIFDIIPFP